MKPLRVYAENYATYGTVDWAIPEGVTAILGQNEAGEGISSNGAGKTRLLELLPLALWGPGSWSDYLAAGSDGVCVVGCEFEHAGDVYRVTRTYNPAGRGKSTLDFEHSIMEPSDDVWMPLTRESIAATQEAIKDLLGIGEATFHHSVFAAQGARHFADAELTPRERSEILADGLGLDRWDAFKEAAAADRLALDREEGALLLQLAAWSDQLEGRVEAEDHADLARVAVHHLEGALVDAREKHAALDGKYRAARQALADVEAVRREVDALASSVRLMEERHDEAVKAAGEIVVLEEWLAEARAVAATIDALAAEVEALNNAEAERTQAVERVALLRKNGAEQREAARKRAAEADLFTRKYDALMDQAEELEASGYGKCDRCGQDMRADALALAVKSLRDEAAKFKQASAESVTEMAVHENAAGELASRIERIVVPAPTDPAVIQAARNRLHEARQAAQEAATIAGRVESLSAVAEAATDPAAAEALTVAREVLTVATGRLVGLESAAPNEGDVNLLARDTLGAQVEVERLDAELAGARTAHGVASERARALAEVATQTEAAAMQQVELRFSLDVLRELEKAYGRSGIPVLLLESLYVPQIEKHTNDFLAAWGVPYTVELVTQREQKTTDRLKDTCEVVVHTPDGSRRYQTYSGGEQDRISTSLRVGLMRTIAAHRGHALEVFALDELPHLDAAGVEKLAELLTELQTEIPVVLFISHSADLSDAFDQRVTVIREDGRSRIEMAA